MEGDIKISIHATVNDKEWAMGAIASEDNHCNKDELKKLAFKSKAILFLMAKTLEDKGVLTEEEGESFRREL